MEMNACVFRTQEEALIFEYIRKTDRRDLEVQRFMEKTEKSVTVTNMIISVE